MAQWFGAWFIFLTCSRAVGSSPSGRTLHLQERCQRADPALEHALFYGSITMKSLALADAKERYKRLKQVR